jgi:mannose-6-phosphate isomerase-like protein (cupin superfamily)
MRGAPPQGHSPAPPFATKNLGAAPDAIAPDGSEVRVLCATGRGSMAAFALPPQAVSRAVAHHTVEEVWYVTAGAGKLWRKHGTAVEVTELAPGVSVTLPVGTHFQFRCDSPTPLAIVAVTMPPWPGEGEAYAVEGIWAPTV